MASRRNGPDLTGLINLTGWTEKRSGLIAPDERLPWGQSFAMGIQHVLAMFGATVVAPLIMGFDANVAIFFSGIGTLIFFVVTGGRIPSYLGSSFAFIAPVGAVTGSIAVGDFNAADIPKALGGIIAAGLLYTIIGAVVDYTGSGWIDALMPPLVTGAVVAIIGLNLAGAAKGLVDQDGWLALITILAIISIALLTKGILGRLPILLGTLAGYLVALVVGGTSAAGRDLGFATISGVDLEPVREAAWVGFPDFVTPSFEWNAISLIAPVAIVLVAENTGHIKAVSAMTNRDLMPWLGRGFMGDGVATMVAGTGGGTGVTTYAENIGVMALTRVYSTVVFVIAAGVAILLGLSPKFGALINSIPAGVLGGVSTVLFGLIAITGARIWVENRVDFSRGVNLFVAAVAIIVGAANYTVHFGNFTFEGITLGTFGAIILYQIFRLADPGAETPVADTPQPVPANREYDVPGTSYPDRPERTRRAGRRGGRPMHRTRNVETERELGELPDLPMRSRGRRDDSGQAERRQRPDGEPPRRRRRPPADDR
ncbi:MAG TPA: solute carrier family 23 protein [Thermomicrobiales bacterium]|nr:solute carrier family 23 protein [Thermomicrobiales bacterium]